MNISAAITRSSGAEERLGRARQANARPLGPASRPARPADWAEGARPGESAPHRRSYVLRVETRAAAGGVPRAERKGEAGRPRAARPSPPPPRPCRGWMGKLGAMARARAAAAGGGGVSRSSPRRRR